MCVIKPSQLSKLNLLRKTSHGRLCWKLFWAANVHFGQCQVIFCRILCIEKVRVMVVGQAREPAHAWGQDSHPSSSRTALPHTVSDQDHSLVLAAGQEPAIPAWSGISAGILPAWRPALVLEMFVCLYRATFHAYCTVSKFLHAPKAQVNKQYLRPLPFPPALPLSGAPLALPHPWSAALL